MKNFMNKFIYKTRKLYVSDMCYRLVALAYDAMQKEFKYSSPMLVSYLSSGTKRYIQKCGLWYTRFFATEKMWKRFVIELDKRGLELVIKEDGIYVE